MQLRSDAVRCCTARAPHRSLLKADGITEQPAKITGSTLQNFKNIFDLYITDSTVDPTQLSSKTGEDANSEFALGDAVFYQNGTWAWTDLSSAGVEADNVGMLPILSLIHI